MGTTKQESPGPFGGWFGTIGGFIGIALVWDLTEDWIAALFIGGIIGGYVGIAVEHITHRVLILGGALLILLVRHGVIRAAIDAFSGG